MLNQIILRKFKIPNDLPIMIDYLQDNGDEYTWPILMAFWQNRLKMKQDNEILRCNIHCVSNKDGNRIYFSYYINEGMWLSFYKHNVAHIGIWDIAGNMTTTFENCINYKFIAAFKSELVEVIARLKKEINA